MTPIASPMRLCQPAPEKPIQGRKVTPQQDAELAQQKREEEERRRAMREQQRRDSPRKLFNLANLLLKEAGTESELATALAIKNEADRHIARLRNG